MDLRLGMSPLEAEAVTGKSIQLAHLKAIKGKKIVNDTIALSECATEFRRSIAFDSLQRLSVIGLTHRTNAKQAEVVKECMEAWLTTIYGIPSIDSVTNDTVQMQIWRTGDTMITMDARPYNERHSFVSIYYFRRELTARKENQ